MIHLLEKQALIFPQVSLTMQSAERHSPKPMLFTPLQTPVSSDLPECQGLGLQYFGGVRALFRTDNICNQNTEVKYLNKNTGQMSNTEQ